MARRISNVTSTNASVDGGGLDIVRQGYAGSLPILVLNADGTPAVVPASAITCKAEFYTAEVVVRETGKNISATISGYEVLSDVSVTDVAWTQNTDQATLSEQSGTFAIPANFYTSDIAIDSERIPVAVLFFEFTDSDNTVLPFVHQIGFRRGQPDG